MSRTIKQKYTGSKAIDKTCRNHGSCAYCTKNRLYKHVKKMIAYRLDTNNNR